jgi:hypothetical protein
LLGSLNAPAHRLAALPNSRLTYESQLNGPDWGAEREIFRALVQRIEIGPTQVAVVLRLPT